MPAHLKVKLVVAISSRALFDFEEENRHLRGQRRPRPTCSCSSSARPAGQAGRRLLAGARSCCAFNDAGDAAGRGGDPVAQRPGLGHARVPLGAGLRHADPARRVHARRVAVALPAAARAPTCSCRPTRPTCARRSTPACRRRACYPQSARASRPRIRTRCASPSTATRCCSPTRPSACSRRSGLDAFQAHERDQAAHAAAPPARSSRCCSRCTGCSTSRRTACASAPRSSPRAARRRTSARSAR